LCGWGGIVCEGGVEVGLVTALVGRGGMGA